MLKHFSTICQIILLSFLNCFQYKSEQTSPGTGLERDQLGMGRSNWIGCSNFSYSISVPILRSSAVTFNQLIL